MTFYFCDTIFIVFLILLSSQWIPGLDMEIVGSNWIINYKIIIIGKLKDDDDSTFSTS